jgi:methionine-S-sulfoxide reductase
MLLYRETRIIVALLATIPTGTLLMAETESSKPAAVESRDAGATTNLEKATFGSGCFWCTEAVFQQLRGVKLVVSGYSGGSVENPSYDQVCTGSTGHAEVIQITYDPKTITFDELLKVFWQTHDPTTLNRQGNDVGTQYRSAVFYHNDEQRRTAQQYKEQLERAGTFRDPIVTEITAFEKFYPAEKYHQNYFRLNPQQQYCAYIIRPKVDKFRKEFKELLEGGEGKAERGRPD